MSAPEIVLFTHQYPFGRDSETFLTAELEVLAARFGRVYVLPSAATPGTRPLPAGAEVVLMPWLDRPSLGSALTAVPAAARLLARAPAALRQIMRHPRTARTYAFILLRNLLKLRDLRHFVRERHLEGAIFYDYWLENTTLALSLLRREGRINTAVARAHGFDVFDDEWPGNRVPFRREKLAGLDAVFPSSTAAAAFLAAHEPAVRRRLHVARLGVTDPGAGEQPAGPAGVPLILTCGALISLKRIHLVPEVLSRLDRPVEWVHLGDGSERGRIEAMAAKLLPPGSWRVAGHLDHEAVMDFYRSHRVAVLLSVSRSEGLPVSMMEAQSFGVPIVACDVGGVAEIVNPRTGILVSAAAELDEIAAGLRAALAPGAFDPATIRAWQRENFDARTNYERFADALLELHGRGLSAS